MYYWHIIPINKGPDMEIPIILSLYLSLSEHLCPASWQQAQAPKTDISYVDCCLENNCTWELQQAYFVI